MWSRRVLKGVVERDCWSSASLYQTRSEPPGQSSWGNTLNPTLDLISWFATRDKSSIQDWFTKKTEWVISLLPLFPLAFGAWNTCAVCFPSHMSLRLHLSHCNYRGNQLQGRIHRPTVVCAKPSVCWAFSRQASWDLADHQVFQFCPSSSTRQISG